MKKLLSERTDDSKYCIRKICGFICIIAGVLFMFSKLIFYFITREIPPLDGRGQFMLGSGILLLGVTSFDGLFIRKG